MALVMKILVTSDDTGAVKEVDAPEELHFEAGC